MHELDQLSIAKLLKLHAGIADELRQRGVLRSANNPTGDLAEHLFCTAFGWTQAPNSERGFDATGPPAQSLVGALAQMRLLLPGEFLAPVAVAEQVGLKHLRRRSEAQALARGCVQVRAELL